MEKYCAADDGMNLSQLFNYTMEVLLIEAAMYFIMDILMVEYDKVHMHVIKKLIYSNIMVSVIMQACHVQVTCIITPPP